MGGHRPALVVASVAGPRDRRAAGDGHASLGCRAVRAHRRWSAATGGAPGAAAGPRPDPRPDHLLRGLPDRPAPGRVRPAAQAPEGHCRPRDCRQDRRRSARARPLRCRRPGRRAVAGQHRRDLRMVPPRRREPLHRPRRSPAGISTEATPTPASPTRRTSTAAMSRSTTSTPHRCCVPASSDTARCCGPRCPQAGGSASTGSAAAPTSPPRSPCIRGCACTC